MPFQSNSIRAETAADAATDAATETATDLDLEASSEARRRVWSRQALRDSKTEGVSRSGLGTAPTARLKTAPYGVRGDHFGRGRSSVVRVGEHLVNSHSFAENSLRATVPHS